jgi:hypothetical protein
VFRVLPEQADPSWRGRSRARKAVPGAGAVDRPPGPARAGDLRSECRPTPLSTLGPKSDR